MGSYGNFTDENKYSSSFHIKLVMKKYLAFNESIMSHVMCKYNYSVSNLIATCSLMPVKCVQQIVGAD